MKFVQLIEYTTTKPEEAQALVQEFLASTQGKRTNGHGMTGRDRDRANKYFNIVEFSSYEDAMKNSELPETQHLAEQMQKLCDGPPTFRNLDIIYEQD
jgi:hypothetical protein